MWTAGWRAAVAGLAAGALTVAVAEVAAAALVRSGTATGTPSPMLAVGGAFVDRTPTWLKDLAISIFATNDKAALLAGMVLVILGAAAGAGVLAVRRRLFGLLVVVALAAVASLAVLSRPASSPTDVLPTIIGAGVGLVVLSLLVDRARLATAGHARRADRTLARRGFLTGAAGAGALAMVGGAAGQWLSRSARAVQLSRESLRLPAPTGVGPTAAETTGLAVSGLSRLVTPLEDFYRIDTALSVPQVPAQEWRLRVHGMVEQEIELDLPALLALPMIERMTTLTCVSNEVGGDLVGNQVWLGHPIRDLLARARPTQGADMVLSTSADGWTAGTPLEALVDPGRDALLAVGMGGVPLPTEHGFPVRMVVPGLYGYVSATKWLVDLQVTRFDRAQGYWTPRGWSARGPVKTASRIDVPRGGATVRAGRVVVAGVAWAQHRGVRGVQVRVDQDPWQAARLGAGGTVDSWRQWMLSWQAGRGEHTVQVRAVDGTGAVQTGEQAPPAPDGATGWHTVRVRVT